jgi:phytoene/squalene synthetase
VRNIYALVRLADEIVDGPFCAIDRHRAATLLTALEDDVREGLRSGYSTNLVVHAFTLTARECGIDADLISPFFASMRTDLTTSVHDDGSLGAYIYGSAEVVGLMCLRAFLAGPDAAGAPTFDRLAPGARRLGAAFQKVNFLRDLAEDHRQLGRTYFPGLDPGHFTDAHRDAVLAEIAADLAAADAVIPALPVSSRSAVRAAHDLFAELSRRLGRTPATQIIQLRVRVPAPVKVWILARALVSGGRT